MGQSAVLHGCDSVRHPSDCTSGNTKGYVNSWRQVRYASSVICSSHDIMLCEDDRGLASTLDPPLPVLVRDTRSLGFPVSSGEPCSACDKCFCAVSHCVCTDECHDSTDMDLQYLPPPAMTSQIDSKCLACKAHWPFHSSDVH